MTIWKPVLHYEQSYHASDQGEIRSLNTSRVTIKRQHLGKDGYLQISLSKPNIGKETFRVHRLIWEAFNGPIPHKESNPSCASYWVVNHINAIRTDNRLANLEIISRAENSSLGADKRRGENSGKTTLTEADVIEIRNRRATGESAPSIAKDFGITKNSVGNIASFKTWSHVGGPKTIVGKDIPSGSSQIGESHPQSKVTENDVIEIRTLKAAGYPNKDLAAMFGVSRPLISNIVTGKRWGHVGDPITPPTR